VTASGRRLVSLRAALALVLITTIGWAAAASPPKAISDPKHLVVS
jgi:hypothetical protein